MKTILTALGLSLALLGGVAHAGANPVVYQQTYANNGNGWSSQLDTGSNGDFSKVYDDFQLSAATTITDVHWTGVYFLGSRTTGVDSFLIQFWSDSGSRTPGALLYSATVTNANETLISGDVYSYDVDLANAFAVQAGTTYWVSIQATMLFPPQWGWAESAQGNAASVQDYFGTRSDLQFDMAYSLTGTPTRLPEPGSLLLAGLALTGAGLMRRGKSLR